MEYTAALAFGFARALDGFRERDCLLGRNISVQTKDGPVSGRAAGINEGGALIVQLSQEQGALLSLRRGDASHLALR